MNGFFEDVGGLILTASPAPDSLNLEMENVSRTIMRSYTSVETTAMGFFTLLCVVGITMNVLVISAFLRGKLYKSPSNLQLFSLAIDDCGTALLVEPLVIVSYLKSDIFLENSWICRFFSSLLHIFPWGSTISILILSMTRVLIVMYPHLHRSYITCKHIYIALCIKYLFLFSFVGVSNFFWVTRFSTVYKQCFVSYVVGVKNDVIREDLGDKMTLPILHMIGGVIIFVINALVIVKLLKIKMRGLAKDRTKHLNNAGIELILLVTVYMVTTVSIPGVFLANILGVQLTADKTALVSVVAKLLFYLQPICNPIIYIIRRPEYRFHAKPVQRPPVVRYNVRRERGKFYKTARALINSRRFIDQIQQSQRGMQRENFKSSDKVSGDSIKLWWNLQVGAQLDSVAVAS